MNDDAHTLDCPANSYAGSKPCTCGAPVPWTCPKCGTGNHSPGEDCEGNHALSLVISEVSSAIYYSDGCRELERLITCGARLGWQDYKWHVFKQSGDSVNEGHDTIQQLIESLAERQRSAVRWRRPPNNTVRKIDK